jgi:hypothetical protein
VIIFYSFKSYFPFFPQNLTPWGFFAYLEDDAKRAGREPESSFFFRVEESAILLKKIEWKSAACSLLKPTTEKEGATGRRQKKNQQSTQTDLPSLLFFFRSPQGHNEKTEKSLEFSLQACIPVPDSKKKHIEAAVI